MNKIKECRRPFNPELPFIVVAGYQIGTQNPRLIAKSKNGAYGVLLPFGYDAKANQYEAHEIEFVADRIVNKILNANPGSTRTIFRLHARILTTEELLPFVKSDIHIVGAHGGRW